MNVDTMLAVRSTFRKRGHSFVPPCYWYSSTTLCNVNSSSKDAPHKGLADMTTNADECRTVYDNWATDYGKDVEKWGYQTPLQVASILAKHLLDSQESSLRILDAGAGDGLSGKALRESFPNCVLMGVDLSPKMLQIAQEKNWYNHLQTLDLNEPPFPFPDRSFDALACVGTMTYVDPAALREFCRLVEPGGLICFTSRTDKLDRVQPVQQHLVDQELWKLVEKTDPLPYLPNHPDFQNDIQVLIFLYQRTNKPIA
mmetsp:Transcript_5019/g.8903  ORF Transcript_5019/g.8903 Transcript_5019/m.8903 type:complete len:256 (-) Transcript_5019:35-802(-)